MYMHRCTQKNDVFVKGFEDLSAIICVQSDAIYIHSIHVHDSTQAYVQDKDMPEGQSGRHHVGLAIFSFACDVNYYAHHRDAL